jgi:pilus assembly protein CpaF
MVLLGGVELPLRAIREQVAASIDLIVHLTRDATGRRYVQTITEVVGMEGDVVSTADLFERDLSLRESSTHADLLPTAVTSMRLHRRRSA